MIWVESFFFCALGANLKNQTFICYTFHSPKLVLGITFKNPHAMIEELPPYSTNTGATCNKVFCETPPLHLSKHLTQINVNANPSQCIEKVQLLYNYNHKFINVEILGKN